jgi:hypothetical protein
MICMKHIWWGAQPANFIDLYKVEEGTIGIFIP